MPGKLSNLYIVVATMVVGCGQPGKPLPQAESTEKPKVEESAKGAGEVHAAPREGNGLALAELVSTKVEPLSCQESSDTYVLKILDDQQLSFDGSIADWVNPTKLILGSPQHHDVAAVLWGALGFNNERKERLIGAVKLKDAKASLEEGIVLDIGFLDAASGSNENDRLVLGRAFKLSNTGVHEWVNGNWIDVPERVLTFKVNELANSLEWQIERHQLDAVMSHSLWWMRMAIGANRKAATGVSFFHSEDRRRRDDFEINVCHTNSWDSQLLRLWEVVSKQVNLSAAERAFAIHRRAYYDVLQVLDNNVSLMVSGAHIISSQGITIDIPLVAEHVSTDFNTAVVTVMSDDLDNNLIRGWNYVYYQEHLKQILSDSLQAQRPHSDKQVIFQFLLAHIEKRERGWGAFMSTLSQDTYRYLGSKDVLRPRGLLALTDQLADDLRLAKSTAFAHMLHRFVSVNDVAQAWSQANVDFWDHLLSEQRGLAQLRLGWLESGNFVTDAFDLDGLNDDDLDGLPNYLELQLGTDLSYHDSDGDGWSDFAELVSATDPLSRLSRPNKLVPDGTLADWQELLPSRLSINRIQTGSSACADHAYFAAYGALLTDSGLLLSIKTRGRAVSQEPVHWSVYLSGLADMEKRRLRMASNQFGFDVIDGPGGEVTQHRSQALLNRGDEMEWIIPADILQLRGEDMGRRVRARLVATTADNNNDFCDQTPWFDVVMPGR